MSSCSCLPRQEVILERRHIMVFLHLLLSAHPKGQPQADIHIAPLLRHIH